MAYDPRRRAPSCGFCGSVSALETLEDPMEQSEGALPFTVDRSEARTALKRWLGGLGWFRPADLRSEARLETLQPLWWVGWVFDARALISWSADSNAGNRRSAWAPHAGQAEMVFDDILVSASWGLTDGEVEAIGPGYDLSTRREAPEGADDATIEQFDLQRSQARRRIIDATEAVATQRVEQEHVPGSRYRNVHVAVLLRGLVTRRLSFPAHVLAYRYKERLYRAVVCGQGSALVHGSAPYSVARILLVVLGGLGVLAILGAIIAMIASA